VTFKLSTCTAPSKDLTSTGLGTFSGANIAQEKLLNKRFIIKLTRLQPTTLIKYTTESLINTLVWQLNSAPRCSSLPWWRRCTRRLDPGRLPDWNPTRPDCP
jgi:hypothetical protein